ncbi:MAG: Major facilitator family transporter [Phenylobacterium sp.]|nr:Major facilitator family transporter [Phenylobacterium sp.]
MARKFPRYQDGLAVLLGLTFGLVFFDRNAINFLSPFIVADLHLSNAQLGMAAAIVSLTWAAFGYLVGRRSDATGRRKPYLIVAVIAFSLCSMASGLVGGFFSLLAVRLSMGVAEGPVPPLSTALLIEASDPLRRGLNIGVYAFFSGLIGFAFAPVILVALATELGWRAAFFAAGAPGLLVAGLLALYVREQPQPVVRTAHASASRPLDVLRTRNVWLCALIATLLLGFLGLTMAYMPLFLVNVRHLSPIDMGWVMSVCFMASVGGALALPTLSDRVGRKPVLVAMATLGGLMPVGALYWTGPTAGLAVVLALAGLGASLPQLAIATVPGESVPDRDRGTALGLVQGVSEIVGGLVIVTLAGIAADRFGLAVVPVLAGVCAVGAGLLSLALSETAPRRARPIGGLALVPSV